MISHNFTKELYTNAQKKDCMLCGTAHHPLSFFSPPLLFTLLNYLLAFLSSAGGQAPSICQCAFVCVFVYAEMNTASHTNRSGFHRHHKSFIIQKRCLYHMLMQALTSHKLGETIFHNHRDKTLRRHFPCYAFQCGGIFLCKRFL